MHRFHVYICRLDGLPDAPESLIERANKIVEQEGYNPGDAKILSYNRKNGYVYGIDYRMILDHGNTNIHKITQSMELAKEILNTQYSINDGVIVMYFVTWW